MISSNVCLCYLPGLIIAMPSYGLQTVHSRNFRECNTLTGARNTDHILNTSTMYLNHFISCLSKLREGEYKLLTNVLMIVKVSSPEYFKELVVLCEPRHSFCTTANSLMFVESWTNQWWPKLWKCSTMYLDYGIIFPWKYMCKTLN